MNPDDDQNCIAAVRNGDADAYGVLVKRYEKPIFNLMWRMTGSQADALDLAQDAFIKAYEQLDRFQSGRKFFPWLYAIAMNLARNMLRDHQRKIQSQSLNMDVRETYSDLDYPQQQEEFMCRRLDSGALFKTLMQLPVGYREAIILRFREELSMEEIADALEISISGAKMRIQRGLHKLRDILKAAKTEHETEESYGRNR